MAIAATPALAEDVSSTSATGLEIAGAFQPSPFGPEPSIAPSPVESAPAPPVATEPEDVSSVEAELEEFATAARRAPNKTTKPPKPPRPPKLQCTSAGVEAFMRRYVVAVNRRKLAQVKQFFPSKRVPIARKRDGSPIVVDANRRGFRWYTVSAAKRGTTKSARNYFIGRTRKRIGRYVAVRRKRGERLRYTTTTGFQPITVGRAPHAGIAFLMKRRANDLLPRGKWRMVKGKALVDCQSGKISAFSI